MRRTTVCDVGSVPVPLLWAHRPLHLSNGQTIDGAIAQHLAGEVTTIATCWKISRRDGVVQGFTVHVRHLEVDGITYKAASGCTRTAIRSTAGRAVDNLDVESVFSDAGITQEALRTPPTPSLPPPSLHPSRLPCPRSSPLHAGTSRRGDDAARGDLADHEEGRRAVLLHGPRPGHRVRRRRVPGGCRLRADGIRSDAGFAVDNLDLIGVFAEGGSSRTRYAPACSTARRSRSRS